MAGGARAAWANGAFPDTVQVLLPAQTPATLVIGTNFGLVISEDSGGTWRWACEHDDSVGGSEYQMAVSGTRIWTLADNGLALSEDYGCIWQAQAAGGLVLFDYFPDVGDATRVFALGAMGVNRFVARIGGGASSALQTLYTAPISHELTTVENARSDPRIIYATLAPPGPPEHGRVVVSLDGGATWTIRDPGPAFGQDDLLIAAVDPADAQTVHFRVHGMDTDRMAVSHDGGLTITVGLTVSGTLTGFTALAGGVLLASEIEDRTGRLYRSTDGGKTFSLATATFHARALAQRNGQVFAATDNLLDGYALAVSNDSGTSWQPVMKLQDIGSIAPCGLSAVCAPVCGSLVSQNVVMSAVCGIDGGAMAGTGDGSTDGATVPPKPGGCSCAVGDGRRAEGSGLTVPAILLACGLIGMGRTRKRKRENGRYRRR